MFYNVFIQVLYNNTKSNKKGEKLKINPYSESFFKKQTVCTDFYGTAFFKSRMPKFMFKDKYKDYPVEQNKEIYLTSAWYKSHYAYEKFKAFLEL